MLNLEDLEQFVAFYETGTLTKTAEEYHISQPSVTRTMKRVEEAFGVPLFKRSANRLEFNEIGALAVTQAKELLQAEKRCVQNVKEADRKSKTLTVLSCAPAPLWDLLPELTQKNPGMTISSKCVDDLAWILNEFREGSCDLILLPNAVDLPGAICEKYAEEHLFFCVKPTHPLASRETLTMEDINGFNCLLYTDIGFWSNLCRRYMPSSKFLVQTDRFEFDELVRESNLPCFTTDYTDPAWSAYSGRVRIPITDEAVNVSYYLIRNHPS